MTVDEVKNELRRMDAPVLRELSAFILQLRRSHDPERKRAIAEMIDSPSVNWISLEELNERMDRE